ncbi:C45 family autoproteolytic acyltransferase/hydolase [Anaerosporobacter faecicola]|uniref:C45 family autoproteolytic acyltransferase/hydolase n=1 Tax=Anaerosporobacter faecicola TaxID=2718714 RepID=UPI00143C671E|nr:C45 family peptidase [Anaerosporobacter faecicola]
MEKKEVLYRKIVMEGSAYEVGKQLAEHLKTDEGLIHFMTSPFMGGDPIPKERLNKVKLLLDQYCPGANEEIQGFADALGVEQDCVIYYYAYLFPQACNCSQLAVTPETSEENHTFLVRNYEFSWNDTPIIMETAIEGQYRQIGFACQLFGRFDGMNEHGLCVATSAGVIQAPYWEEGFVFPIAVRAILNQCKTVQEAIELFKKLPFADYRNICLADRFGNIARIQAAASMHTVDRSDNEENYKYLIATNHYVADQLKAKRFYTPSHSITRQETMEHCLAAYEKAGKKISEEAMKKLLEQPMPEGVCCHYYGDGMGTMWSEVFDATEKSIQVCFGSPDDHQWRKIDFHSEPGMKEYRETLKSVTPPEGFWEDTNK